LTTANYAVKKLEFQDSHLAHVLTNCWCSGSGTDDALYDCRWTYAVSFCEFLGEPQ